MLKRIVAIAFIFVCASAAWMILGATIFSRTYDSGQTLADRVASLWGGPQVRPRRLARGRRAGGVAPRRRVRAQGSEDDRDGRERDEEDRDRAVDGDGQPAA